MERSSIILILLFFILCEFSCTSRSSIDKVQVAGVNSPDILLNGTWKFAMDPSESFWENETSFETWPSIEVPGECQMQGFAIKHDQPYVYKHNFDIPSDYVDKEISIDFHGVYSYTRVWINGSFVRDHHGGFTKWSCNITDHVVPGEEAILTVEITDRVDDISYGSGYAKHQIGGILRKVLLKARPLQNFRNYYFETDLDEYYKDAQLKLFYELSLNTTSTILMEIYDPKDKIVSSKRFDKVPQKGVLGISMSNPLKWDAEHPNLYKVVLSLFEKEKELLKVQKSVGFREVLVKGNKLLVNGTAVKLRGACRHDIHPLLGRMTTPEYDLRDVLLAKEANINFIRTSHYPPSESFLDYCDEYGIYVEDETAVCFVGSHRTFDYQTSGATQNLSAYTDRYISQLQEMMTHHRNHPSVIIWSIGNENVFGLNFIKSYRYVKEKDKTRPVIYSYPGQVPDSVRNFEILSMHYPDWRGNLNQYGVSTRNFSYDEMPVLFDEWAHVPCYNNPTLRYDPNVRNFWGQSLDSMWTNLFNADGGLGGAIWCMIDETFMLSEDLEGSNQWWGKLDPNVIPATYMGPTVGYGEWGIIDTWRRKKPEFWATKKAYSPAKILVKKIEQFKSGQTLKLPVHNRFDHTNFNELTIDYQYLGISGKLEQVDIAPHSKGMLEIPLTAWTDDSKLEITFADQKGRLIDKYQIQIGEKKNLTPELQPGNLEIKEKDKSILVTGNNFGLEISKESGLLKDLIVEEDTLIKTGPYINLSVPGRRVQYSTIIMDDYAQNWKLGALNYVLIDGIVQINTKGSYDSIDTHFKIQIDEKGLISIGYKIINAPSIKIQEAGLKFIMGNQFAAMNWDRNSYFTYYPEYDLGNPKGKVDINDLPIMKYREEPSHDWAMDHMNFYYHGLHTKMRFSNTVRSMKENFYSFGLSTSATSLMVTGNGKQACRFDKINHQNVLLVNDLWDYQSLLWGNYMKMLDLNEEFDGKVFLHIDKNF